MLPPTYFLYGVFTLAALALLVNIRVKLPKKIFLFLAVLTVVATCWVAMNPFREVADPMPQSSYRKTISAFIAESVVLVPGINEFSLSFQNSDVSCNGVSYSLIFEAEQGDIHHSDCSISIKCTDGGDLKPSAFLFSGNTLKIVFVFSSGFDCRKISLLEVVCKTNVPLNLRSLTEEKVFN